MSSRPWMPFYIGDYLADTQHLTTLQHGMYLLLMLHYWQHGSLPVDDKSLQKICRSSPYLWRRNKAALAAFFRDGWRHKRVEKELRKAAEISARRAMAGRKGGLVSSGKTNVERFVGQTIAKQKGTHPQPHVRQTSSEGVEKQRDGRGMSSLGDIVRKKGWTPE